MSSLLAVERSRPATALWIPPGRVRSWGADAVELAAEAGLVLDDWQAWSLDHALAERADGRWCAFEVCEILPRQNGKGAILEALELYHLFVLGTRLIIHSAHELATAEEHFHRLWNRIEDTPDLRNACHKPYMTNGRYAIRLKNGCRLRISARSHKAIRGFSGELIVLDEAMFLEPGHVGAMGPALSAMQNPQVWYTGSAPFKTSHVFHAVRNRGRDGGEDRLFFAEWANTEGVGIDDQDALERANPGYPHRLTPENVHAERRMMAALPEEYLRERLGVPDPEEVANNVFPAGMWDAARDPALVGTAQIVALDVAPGLEWASLAGWGPSGDFDRLEILQHRRGTDWIVDALRAFAVPVVVDPRGPVGGVLPDLRAAGIELRELSSAEVGQACILLQERVLAGRLRHLGQQELDTAVQYASVRMSGDVWRWGRISSSVDISPLVAATLALFAGQEPRKSPPKYFSASEL